MAGLSPQDISQALQFKFTGEELERKKISDLVDMTYKRAQIEQMRKPEPLDQPYAGGLTHRQFNSLTPDAKEYVLAKQGAKVLGDDEFMTKREWENTKPTERQRFLEGLAKNPNLLKLEKELREAGRTTINIGETVKKAEALEDVKSRKYFTSPKGLVADVDKYVSSEEVQSKLFAYADDPRKMEIETIRAKEKFILGKIAASGGTIIDGKLEGRTFVFKVKWDDGSTSEVRYAN